MDVTISGTAFDYATDQWSTFSMSFGLAGGWYEAAGCDSWIMDAQVTDFHATFAAPTSFSANLTRTPYPCGGQVYAGLSSGPMVLQSTGDLFSPGSTLTGSFGTSQIESSSWSVQHTDPPSSTSSVPEPGTLMLAVMAVIAWRLWK